MTEPTGTPSVVATLLVKRAVSSTPAWPNTRFFGKLRRQLGQRGHLVERVRHDDDHGVRASASAMFSATPRTILALTSSRSMRLMPGLRGRPAVITTTSESAVAS